MKINVGGLIKARQAAGVQLIILDGLDTYKGIIFLIREKEEEEKKASQILPINISHVDKFLLKEHTTYHFPCARRKKMKTLAQKTPRELACLLNYCLNRQNYSYNTESFVIDHEPTFFFVFLHQ